MKSGKKAFFAGIMAIVMAAGSSATVLAAEASQVPEENSQSVTQQDKQYSEKNAGKIKTAPDGESTTENGFKKGGHHRKAINSEDGTDEVRKPKRHAKDKSAEDVQTSEDGTETSKRKLHKKGKSVTNESTEQTANA